MGEDSSAPGGPVAWVFTERQLQELIAAVRMSERVVVDLETTGLREHARTGGELNGGVAARIVFASFTLPQCGPSGEWDGTEPTTFLLPLSHPQSPFQGTWRETTRRVMQAAVDADRPIENANVKYDARYVYATTGVDLSGHITWDTQVSSHLLDENRSTALKKRAPETFDIDAWDDVPLNYPGAAEDADIWDLGAYSYRDTWWVWRLVLNHRYRMFLDDAEWPETAEEREEARLGSLATWVAMPMVQSLTRIEQNGFRLDTEWVKAQLKSDENESERLLQTLAERYGLDYDSASTAGNSKWFKDLTEKAREAGELRLVSTTQNGNPQWTKATLGKLARDGYTVAQQVLDQRNVEKRAQYLRSWLSFQTRAGDIHATYWPGRVATGRLACEGPNLQQCSRELRNAFVPREGYVLGDFDYSAIELRVVAAIADERNMIAAFQRGDDLHRLFAARLTGKAPQDVTKDERQKAKSANFGLLYMQQPEGFREYAESNYGVAMTEHEAVRVYNEFFDAWPGLREWHQHTTSVLHRDGQIVSPLGRIRRLPQVWDGNPSKVGEAERMSVNSPVQGMASDLLQLAAASIQGFLYGSSAIQGVRIVATVHDSLVVEIDENRVEELSRAVVERMQNLTQFLSRMGVDLRVPLVAEAELGSRWGLNDLAA